MAVNHIVHLNELPAKYLTKQKKEKKDGHKIDIPMEEASI
jgi:hypothetical protein